MNTHSAWMHTLRMDAHTPYGCTHSVWMHLRRIYFNILIVHFSHNIHHKYLTYYLDE